MSRSVDELEREVQSIQDDLSRDLDVLAGHLPKPDDIGKVVGVIAAAAIGTWVLLSWLLSARRRAKDRKNITRAVREALDDA